MQKTTETENPLVHTQSLTVQNPTTSYRERLLNGFTKTEFLAVRELYESLKDQKALWRLLNCKTLAYFYRHKRTGQVRVSSKSCHIRFCPLCSSSRRKKIEENTKKWLLTANHPKLLTLTLKHRADSLLKQLDRFYACYKQLRRLKIYKKNIIGSIWFFQVKIGKDGLWHPHLHIVCEGNFVSRTKLSREWERITTDSPVIDIRAIKDIDQVATYVSRHSVQPIYMNGLSTEQKQEVFYAFAKRRMCGTTGTAAKLKLTSNSDFVSEDWECVGSWTTVQQFFKESEDAQKIWKAYITKNPLDEGISLKMIDDFIDEKPPPFIIEVDKITEDKFLW